MNASFFKQYLRVVILSSCFAHFGGLDSSHCLNLAKFGNHGNKVSFKKLHLFCHLGIFHSTKIQKFLKQEKIERKFSWKLNSKSKNVKIFQGKPVNRIFRKITETKLID